MHEVLVNRLGGLSLPRKSVVRLTDRPDMTLDVYRGCKTTIQQQQQPNNSGRQCHLVTLAEDHLPVVCQHFQRTPRLKLMGQFPLNFICMVSV